MAPARNLLLRHCDSYGTTFFDRTQLLLHERSDLIMAEKAARGGARGGARDEVQEEAEKEEEAACDQVSAPAEEASSGWLQLGAGTSRKRPADRVTELELFPSRPPPAAAVGAHGQFWTTTPSPSSSSSGVQFIHPSGSSRSAQAPGGSQPPPGPRPAAVVGVPGLVWSTPSPSSRGSAMQFMRPSAGISSGGGQIQVVSPQPRAQTGLWLVLRAAENQIKQPFLPQIPKSFLRIKDGRMTARLLLKYLADKLGLEDESAVQISCRGQQIPPLMTLQQIRDQIWCPGEPNLLLPQAESSATDHLMALHYSRS